MTVCKEKNWGRGNQNSKLGTRHCQFLAEHLKQLQCRFHSSFLVYSIGRRHIHFKANELSACLVSRLWEPKQLLKYLCPFLSQATKVPLLITWDQPNAPCPLRCCWIPLHNEPSFLRKARSNHSGCTSSISPPSIPGNVIGLTAQHSKRILFNKSWIELPRAGMTKLTDYGFWDLGNVCHPPLARRGQFHQLLVLSW